MTFTAAQLGRRPARRTDATEDLVWVYLEEVGRHPLLTAADEVHLAQTMEAGRKAEARLAQGVDDEELEAELREAVEQGERARYRFVLANLRLVISIAAPFQSSTGLSLLDLVQEGNLGLLRAVDKFDWRKGFKFSTYATWWIREAIQRGATAGGSVYVPRYLIDARSRLKRVLADAEQRPGGPPADDELAQRADVSPTQLERLRGLLSPALSLDEPVAGDERTPFLERVGGMTLSPPEDDALDRVEAHALHRAIEELAPIEAEVVRRRFGLVDQPATVKVTAAALGLTIEQVRSAERRALRKLRARCSR